MKQTKLNKQDLILMLVFLTIAAISYVWIEKALKTDGEYAMITVQGGLYETLNLHQDAKIFIVEGDFENVFCIKDGMAFMERANCPDQLCVKHKPISKNGESIICLPNKVVVEMKSNDAKEYDH